MKKESNSELLRNRRAKLKKFYDSQLWQDTRELALKRDKYLCQMCNKPAVHVHHKIHLNESNVDQVEVALNLDNLISLCHSCHDQMHRGEHGKGRIAHEGEEYNYTFDENGYLIPK